MDENNEKWSVLGQQWVRENDVYCPTCHLKLSGERYCPSCNTKIQYPNEDEYGNINSKGKRVERFKKIDAVGVAMQEVGTNMAGCGCIMVILMILMIVLMLFL